MVVVAQCTGLRAEEVLALEWQDIDFENLSMRVVRAVVHGRVKTVKTEYSEDDLPLDPEFATVLLDWKRQTEAEAEDSTPSVGLELVFRSHVTARHYRTAPIQQDDIRPAGLLPGGVSEVRYRGRRLVPTGQPGSERRSFAASRRALGGSREVRRDWVAHLPSH